MASEDNKPLLEKGNEAAGLAEEKKGDAGDSKLTAENRDAKIELTIATALITTDLNIMYDKILRRINLQMCLLSGLSFFFIVTYIDFCFKEDELRFTDAYDECSYAFWFKSAAWLSFTIFVLRLIKYYELVSERLMQMWGYTSRWDAFKRSEQGNFAMEVLINACMPLPATDNWQLEANLVILLIFARIYLVIRAIRDISPIWMKRHQVEKLESFRKANAEVDTVTVFVAYFHTYTMLFTSLSFCVGLAMVAYTMHLVERQYWWDGDGNTWRMIDYPAERSENVYQPVPDGFSENPYALMSNCFWFSIVTASTVGYGDFAPKSIQGRVVATVIIFFGLVMTSLLSGLVINALEMSPQDVQLQQYRENREANYQMQLHAAKIIQTAFRIRKDSRRKENAITRVFDKLKARRQAKDTIRMQIRPLLKALKKHRLKYTSTTMTKEYNLRTHMIGRVSQLNEKLDTAEEMLREQHAQKFQEIEDEIASEKLAAAKGLIYENNLRKVEKLKRLGKL